MTLDEVKRLLPVGSKLLCVLDEHQEDAVLSDWKGQTVTVDAYCMHAEHALALKSVKSGTWMIAPRNMAVVDGLLHVHQNDIHGAFQLEEPKGGNE